MYLRKIWLNINGANRIMVCNPEKDSLADVLRRIGLTGTKIGCNAGQCGACTVLLEGKPIRSCVKKMKNVPEYSKIITIEGIGTPQNLHPLQKAWITYGGVQCGFCSPGFIVSAKGLLDVNPAPTREEVRAWFQKHRNVCRCTGYKPLIDAVMAAAEVLRGEKTMEDLEFKMPENGRIYNSRYPKPTALEKVTGLCDYGDDIGLKMPPGTLHLALVQPEVAHGNILNIDFEEAEAMPGVVKVITAKDVKGTNLSTKMVITIPRSHTDGRLHPLICGEKVWRHGDVVAVVAARTREEARAAAKAVKVTIEPLSAYSNALDAVAPGAIRIHKQTPNTFLEFPLTKGEDTRKILPEAAYVVEGSFYSTRQPHLTIEPDVHQAYSDEEGRLTIQCKSQSLHGWRKNIAEAVGLPTEKVRIIENPTGATFGYGMTDNIAGILGVCVMALNSPVTLTMSYHEHMITTGKRTPCYTNGRLACDKDGKIIALEYDTLFEHGAYPDNAQSLMAKACRFIGQPYDIPNVMGISRATLTNHDFGTAFRGYGAPQAYTASEALIDMMAEKIGMDPFDFRYKNIARPGALTINSYPYLQYPIEEMLDKLRHIYENAKEKAKTADTPEKRRGVGIVCGAYSVARTNDTSEVALELNADGTITHYNSWAQQGQGSDIGTLVHTHEALRPLGITPDKIKLVQNDTAITPVTGPAAASRCHYMAGTATIVAANLLMDAMRKPDGSYRTYEEMVAENIPTKYLGVGKAARNCVPMDYNTGKGDPNPDHNYISCVAEVEVDVATGKTKVLAVNGIADVGVVGNFLAVEGQAYGGTSHCIGFALSENFDDVKKHSTMAGAGIPYCEDIPDEMNFIFHETPREGGPHGSGGASEIFQSAAHMSVINAINNAVGVRIYELPATPEKVKAAMNAKAQGKELKPDKYFLGSDFYETWDHMMANPVKNK